MDCFKKALEIAIHKTDLNIRSIGNDLREFTAQPDGLYFKEPREQYIQLNHVFGWTQSFFTGMATLAYQLTREEKYLKWLKSLYDNYYDKVFKTPMDTMHDLGFIYTPYAVALYKITKNRNMKKISVKAADDLAKRFIPNGGYIRAWGRMDDQIPPYIQKELAKNHFFTESKGLAIVDCMMNLPLMFWASEETGHPYYKRIAIEHANMTLKYFIRQDDSIYHAYRFDEETGKPIGGANYCGYSVESHWARGTAWAIYGFAIAYGYTGKKEYLDAAIRLSKKFIHLCEDDSIPVWDFRLPEDKPALYCGSHKEWYKWDIRNAENKEFNRDTSAAAIAVCGFREILKHISDETISNAADQILKSLVEKYMDYDVKVPGLLKCQNGQMNYTIFGDYFLMEALATRLYSIQSIW